MSFLTVQYALLLCVAAVAFRLADGTWRAGVAVAASALFYASWDASLCMLMFAAAIFAWQAARDLRSEPARWPWAGGVLLVLMLVLGWLAPAADTQGHNTWLAGLAAVALLWAVPWLAPRCGLTRAWRFGLYVGALLAVLAFFKYANFFLASIAAVLGQPRAELVTLNVLLPVGISFYVFQKISYLVDCWRGDETDSPGLVEFCAYATFFPQLVAGPIERVRQLLPQLRTPQALSGPLLVEAGVLLLMGYFKKVYVADNCALVANFAFDSPQATGPGWLVLGALAFAIQIYGDFSGYTDIARGSALLLGVRLSGNFALPYAATSVIDFWHRWHITLSTWLRDYLYKPLGGSRHGLLIKYRNLLIVMALGGLWHGASWNFVVWGVYWGVLLVINHAWRDLWPAHRQLNFAKPWRELCGWVMTFALVLLGWVLFRATDLSMLGKFLPSATPMITAEWRGALNWTLLHGVPLLLVQLMTWRTGGLRDETPALIMRPVAGGILLALALWFTLASDAQQSAFIYFQF